MLLGLIATRSGATRALRLPAVWLSSPSRSSRRPRSAISRRVSSKSMPFPLPYRPCRIGDLLLVELFHVIAPGGVRQQSLGTDVRHGASASFSGDRRNCTGDA